jgi:hypothetical protein
MRPWSEEPARDLAHWRNQWDGAMFCACDHGHNQWLKENEAKASLIIRILLTGGKTSLDKLVRMENDRVNKIWYWLAKNDSRRNNAIIDAEMKKRKKEKLQ